MVFYVYDEALVMVSVIDDAVSAIWTGRYYKPGDFELYLRASSQAAGFMRQNCYIKRADKDSLCVIEHVEIQEDAESGDHYIVSGRDLKSLLGRRIVWSQTALKGGVEDCLRKLVSENAIDTAPERVIPRLVLGEKSGFAGTMAKQLTGKNLMEAVSDICTTYQCGCDVLFLAGEFQVIFYKGENRSYSQAGTDNPYVVFSAEFDNLISSIYVQDISEYQNVALVAGEGEGKARRRTVVGEASGMDRYELYVDARDISSNEGEISESDYMEQLYGRGLEKLEAALASETFEGEVDNTSMYIYGEDYFLGDIVAVKNKYGITGNARVVEMIECWDDGGYTAVPTFETCVEGGSLWQ
ncbi:MAG: siphovirus ReqiPepy6 Gp37-like family protein [Lachnospiraceae bacterium]|nr:siphovirus ReqiPepy6 Gp37-like family protein [Lachnospiraceae bacterium]